MKKYRNQSVLLIVLIAAFSLQGFSQKQGRIQTVKTEKFQKKLLKKKQPQLIDVRTAKEFSEGHLPGASHYNVMDSTLQRNVADLNRKRPVFVYCKSGTRSMKAAEFLRNNGFRVINLDGGITAWRKSGLSEERDER